MEHFTLARVIEGRFAIQAKITTLLTGLTGFCMLHVFGAWNRYFDYRFWWIHAMTLVWVLLALKPLNQEDGDNNE